ncbi:hypothetical protein GQ53DRAFT_814675 [Thozetella sp. PMI_491]|nr:hypothetical protein GQ53DRAFT_814675 [Thozetella sp. PMI_491]
MSIVGHVFDAIPESEDVVVLQRREELLLSTPPPTEMKLWREHPTLQGTHFAQEYVPAKFAPPRDVYDGKTFRLEWQQMDNRQPFYHRNADVDEISYQVSGERTLMAELGTTELRPGDFSRIPVGIAHDNYGRKGVHLLFYVIAPSKEVGQTASIATRKGIPFAGWKPATANEMVTECLGAVGCDLSIFLVDEELILHGKCKSDSKLVVQRPVAVGSEVEWLYQSDRVWLGHIRLNKASGDVYVSHRRATAVHYQISGSRTIVSQRGAMELLPGDFVSIPKGVAYTSVSHVESSHIVILSSDDITLKAEATKTAVGMSPALLKDIRGR